jgi:hypothetical protein
MYKLYISNKGELAIQAPSNYTREMYDIVKHFCRNNKMFGAGAKKIFYLKNVPFTKVPAIIEAFKESRIELQLDPVLRSHAVQQVRELKTQEAKQKQSAEPTVKFESLPPIQEQSLYQYVKDNHVPLPKEKTISQRQLQYLIRQHPEEAVEFILTTEDEKSLEYIVFGDWTVEEVQVFDKDGWTLMMRGYNLNVPTVSGLNDYIAYCLPKLYKAAREYKNQKSFEIFQSNLECLIAE